MTNFEDVDKPEPPVVNQDDPPVRMFTGDEPTPPGPMGCRWTT